MLRRYLQTLLFLSLLVGCMPSQATQEKEPTVVDVSTDTAKAIDGALAALSMPLPNQPPPLTNDSVEIPEDALVPTPDNDTGRSYSADTLVADIAIEADYELYQKFGSESATRNYITQLISDVSAIYERDINVRLKPSFIRIATTPSDPWTSPTTSGTLSELRDYWNFYESGRQRAVVLLLSGRNLGGGVAYLGSVCYSNYQPTNSYDYAVAANLRGNYTTYPSTNTWDVVVVAHELGHSFNSNHAHCYRRTTSGDWYSKCYNQEAGCYNGPAVASNGTIMSYCHVNGGDQKINPLAFTDGDPAMTNVMRSFAESIIETNPYGCLQVDNTSSGTVSVNQAWTANTSGNIQSSFSSNETVLYYARVDNTSSSAQTVYFDWDITGPCGFNDGWNGNLTINPGVSNWYLESTIPSGACSGTYTYHVSAIYNGVTDSADTTFTVGSTVTPTPTPPPATMTPFPPTATPDTGTNTLISISPSTQTTSLTSDACVDVIISNASAIGSFQFDLTFPNSLLHVSDVTAGAFLGSTGRTTVPFEEIDNANGTLTYGGASFGSQPGASGNGVLGTVCFTPQSDGTAALNVANSQLTNVPGDNISHNTQGGMIIISSCYWADLDCDGDVDIVDIQLVAGRWGSVAGDGAYNANYDLDDDGDIDIVDVQRVAAQWNWRARSSTVDAMPPVHGNNVAQATLTFLLDPDNLNLEVGESTTIELDVTDADNLAAFQTILTYNPEHIRVDDVTLASFLGSTGRVVVLTTPDIDNVAGEAAFGAFSFGIQPGVNGAGTLAMIEITAIGEGSGAIDMNNSIATGPSGNEYSVVEVDGHYQIGVVSTPTPTATSVTPTATPVTLTATPVTPTATPVTPTLTPPPTTTPPADGGRVEAGSYVVRPNDQVTINVSAFEIDAPGVGAATVDIQYDPSVLDIVSCQSDPDGAFNGSACNIDFTSDTVRFSLTSSSGETGDIALAEVVFEAIGSDGQVSPLDVTLTTWADKDGADIISAAIDGSVTLQAGIIGDVNCNDVRNVIDSLFVLQYTVGSREASDICPPPSNALYTPLCDTNADNSCNVIDALFIIQCEVGNHNVLCPSGRIIPANRESVVATSSITVGSDVIVGDMEVTIPVSVSVPADVAFSAATVDIIYDDTVIDAHICNTNGDFVGSCHITQNEVGDNVVRFSVASSSARAGNVELVEIVFAGSDGIIQRTSDLIAEVEMFVDAEGNQLPYTTHDGKIDVSSVQSNISLKQNDTLIAPNIWIAIAAIMWLLLVTVLAKRKVDRPRN